MVDLSEEELAELKEILAPLIVNILADRPENIIPLFLDLGLDLQTAESIERLVEHINSYPEEYRNAIISSVLEGITYKVEEDENGGIRGKFDYDKLEIPKVILINLPYIMEVLLTHPQDVGKVLQQFGVDKAITDWMKENPWKFAGISILAVISFPLLKSIGMPLVTLSVLADAVIRIVQAATEIAKEVKEAIITLYTALKNVVNAFAQWVRNNFNAGEDYVRSNPYIKADTARLRNYATRINNVNRRLKKLDNDLNSLYTQVGLLDLWDILCANLLTGGSPTLNQVRNYLNNTADRLDTAENKAYGYIGG